MSMKNNIKIDFNKAVQFEASGKYKEAEKICQSIIENDNKQIDAWNLLGIIAIKTGNKNAVKYFKKACNLNKDEPVFHYNLGLAYEKNGLIRESEQSYKNAIKIKSDYMDAYNRLGLLLKNNNKLYDALQIFQKAINVKPDFFPVYTNIGTILSELGKLDQALTYFNKAIELNPLEIHAYNNKGNIFQKKGDMLSAVDAYEKALKIDPNYVEGYSNLGNALRECGQIKKAEIILLKALELSPNYANAHNNLALVYSDMDNYEKAMESFNSAIQINPMLIDPYSNIAGLYIKKGKLDKAIYFSKRAISLASNYAQPYNNLGVAFSRQCNIDESINNFKKAIKIKPDYYIAYSNYLFTLNYDHRLTSEQIFNEHSKYGNLFNNLQNNPYYLNNKDYDRPLNIGYVSPDFYQHSVAFFVEAILKNHNKDQFKVFCYADNTNIDSLSTKLRKMSYKWIVTCGINDDQLYNKIRSDKIDILVDLTGHTANNRLLVFARKAAPIQITYLGYPNTTGLKAIQYRITDEYADPPGYKENEYSEKLIRIPNNFLCYSPPDNANEAEFPPVIKNKYITFGSFNIPSKINNNVIALWSEILKKVTNSKIMLKSKYFGCQITKDLFINRFKQNGIEEDRLIIMGYLPSFNDHRKMYDNVDISLDTFPYNGTTTTCEALWMGVPVITLNGDRHASRVGVSILNSIGLMDCIADNEDEYINKAIYLANDIELLSNIRKNLRNLMKKSPLTDGKVFTKKLESLYRNVWKNHCNEKNKV